MLELILFIIAVVVVVLVIDKVGEMLAPTPGIAQIIKYVAGGIGLILILKRAWPFLAHAGLF